jgi:hypothetical protein
MMNPASTIYREHIFRTTCDKTIYMNFWRNQDIMQEVKNVSLSYQAPKANQTARIHFRILKAIFWDDIQNGDCSILFETPSHS